MYGLILARNFLFLLSTRYMSLESEGGKFKIVSGKVSRGKSEKGDGTS